jgi:hypothetical protein
MAQDVALREAFEKFKRRVDAALSILSAVAAQLGTANKFTTVATIAVLEATNLSKYLLVLCESDRNGDFALYVQDSTVTVDGINGVQDGVGTKFKLQN